MNPTGNRVVGELLVGHQSVHEGDGLAFSFRVAFDREPLPETSTPDTHGASGASAGVGPSPGVGLGDFIMKPRLGLGLGVRARC